MGNSRGGNRAQALVCIAMLMAIAPQSLAASAPKGECRNLWKMYGLFMRASIACNFPESNAIRKTLKRLKAACPLSTEQEARKDVANGFAQFDKELKQEGHSEACGEMYKFMDAVGR